MQDERIEFADSEVRTEFFEELKKNCEIEVWDELYKKFNVSRSVFQNYRYGIRTLPNKLFKIFLKYFSKEQKNYFLSKINKKPSNWGASLGGKTTAEKHPEQFEKARKIAIKRSYMRSNDFKHPFERIKT